MPRFPRSSINTCFFHVMTQGINKSFIFDKQEDIMFYIKTMYALLREQNIEIIAYCIMNNHSHILIKTSEINELYKYMQRLNTKYAKYYNKKYERVGYVFRDRYKSEGIYTEKQLYNCIKYIYDNPVKAGICNLPEQYKYSNYKKIDVQTEENYMFIDIDSDTENQLQLVIDNFLLSNKITFSDLIKNKQTLRKLVLLLKCEYNISLRKISDMLGVNREKIRKIYNN